MELKKILITYLKRAIVEQYSQITMPFGVFKFSLKFFFGKNLEGSLPLNIIYVGWELRILFQQVAK